MAINTAYRYYIRIDSDNNVIDFFNGAIQPPTDSDIFYQFSELRNLQLDILDQEGRYKYYYDADEHIIVEYDYNDINYLDDAIERRVTELQSKMVRAIESYYPSYEQTRIANQINTEPGDFGIMMEFINRMEQRMNSVELQIRAQTTVEAVNSINIDVFDDIRPPASSPISADETNYHNGIYQIRQIHTLTATDISNGYIRLTPAAIGGASEPKRFVKLRPIDGIDQEYAEDYTAYNTDDNNALVIISTEVASINGLSSFVTPTEGMDELELNDRLVILYR